MADVTPGTFPCDGEDLLSAYLDGELRPGELERVSRHLADCSSCVAVFHRLKAVRTALRVLPPVVPPPWVVPHFHIGDELSAYLDGELATAEIDAVGVHIAGCADCRIELAELDAARTAVRALPRLEPAEPFPDTMSEATVPQATRPRRRRLVAGLAAAAVVASVVAIGADRGGSGAPVDIDELLNRHNARSSVESGFSVNPVVAPPEPGR